MSSSGRLHRATAIIPLAVLSAAWTASLVGGIGSASADADGPRTLPDGTVLPTAVIEEPASIGDAVTRAAAFSPGSASDIPQAALSAYQRAEAVINKADKGCNVPWELIAAIGRVESDHGRSGGNILDARGVARPGIYGVALDGRGDTQLIADTDAGQYDDDTRHDRAVGPMQFIPSTWAVVGVDGDGDGTRNPQDVDDAALATAVYLCSGDDDLSAEQGQRAAVYRYNHSNDYVDLVLEIMQAYLDGDFAAVPTSTPSTDTVSTTPTSAATDTGDRGGKGGRGDHGGKGDDEVSPTKDPSPTKNPTPTQSPTPTQAPTQTPTQAPTQSPTKNPTPTQTPTVVPTTLPTQLPTVLPTVVPTLLTEAQATTQCLTQLGLDGLVGGVLGMLALSPSQNAALTTCVNGLLAP